MPMAVWSRQVLQVNEPGGSRPLPYLCDFNGGNRRDTPRIARRPPDTWSYVARYGCLTMASGNALIVITGATVRKSSASILLSPEACPPNQTT